MSSSNRSVAATASAVLGTLALCHKAAEAFVPSTPQVHPPAASETIVKGDASSSLQSSASTSLSDTATVSAAGAVAVAGLFLAARRQTSARVEGRATSSRSVAVHAFETELGVQAPTGFFDPLGLSSDGSIENFKRRRASEIKHGRVAMLATMGYMTPEITGKFPGYLSYSQSIKFEDVPNGLAAMSKVPALGWAQVAAYGAVCELSQDQSPGTPGAAGDFGFKVITSDDEEVLKRKLNSELANGRLAMMAIIGLFFQDGLTGGAYGDWASYTDSPLRAFESELGAQPPLGFWDPLGLSADGDVDFFKRRREVEIKHGRVAMYAAMGYIVPEYFRFPGYLSPKLGLKFDDVPNGLAAFSKVPSVGWQQIVSFIGIYELFINKPVGDEPGNFGKGNLGIGLGKLDEATRARKLASELANGRLAMMAIIGMFFQDGLTGSAWGDWANYVDSPLRAFESELGAQAPLGFFDPLKLTGDGSVEAFKRRRQSEIKHGRISMLAAMGYMTPEITGKFPGYLSPSLNLKFADVPNGLAAVSKVPAAGWAQILGYMAYCETSQDQSAGTPGAAGEFGFKVITSDDDEVLKRKLASELANGRLAMMAIIGMFYQDGLTGSPWGDWSLYTDSPLRAFESERGVQAPVGFWDPLGLAADGDVATFRRRRAVEIKHGRICMLACIGYIVPEYVKFPGYLAPSEGLKFADVPNGLGALAKVPAEGWLQIGLFLGHYEGYFFQQDKDRSPGDFEGYGFLGIGKNFIFDLPTPELSDADKEKKLSVEIANGRLAMVAIIGMFYQDGLTGSAWGDWSLYTDSPLRAFESELGAQPPLGFWDPLGFSADGDVYSFTRRRSVEIKHGRICMLATMGYITPEITGKLPGYLSPSESVKFADVPNGLAAISKVPILGWCQIILYMAFCEINGGYDQDVQKGKPGDFGFKVITSSDPETLKKKLSAEIANGRLAMMAIIGMFFQDGLTGSAWGDWANYTDSPLRAFENERGVQAPVGYWDPLGFARDGNVALFKIRRATEIKHGRISMLAAMGYITPEVTGKFPGYLSPSMGLKFADIPNGLAAISKVPGYGWAQILGWMAFCEISVDQSPGKPGAAGDMGFKAFKVTADAPETTEKKLASELANGRLAMMAIIGMFFQDGLTGSAWGDWANFTESPLRAFESELGAQAPVGFFDPLGLSSDGDVETFKRRRASEIKHGRIAMLATMGYMTPELTGKFPGYLSPSAGLKFADIPNGLAAVSKVPAAGWAQVALYAFHVELIQDQSPGTPGQAGDFGFKVITSDNEEVVQRKLASELANGRLAMMAIIGMFFQDGLTGSAYGDWANYTGSPLRAFESELGAQAPLGFFDPLKLTGDGSVEAFKRRRQSEIKHGRISMLAAMGYMTPEITGKFPGYLSPSLNLKFADVPNGLAAVSKVPAAGWAQILGYMAYCETSQDQSAGTPGAAGEFGFKVITSDDDEVLKRKLASELANGRLAMMAIIGMFYQDGLTGSPWGDWSLYTDSPLRAFESERGAQPPFGFWDPLGLSADGDVATFKRRRASEIKHGRIAMLAAMGYMTPEITGKFPGYLSPSTGVKYADIPNGLAAISKVPVVGWLQIFAWTAVCELWEDQVPGTPGHEGEFCFKAFKVTSDAPETRETKLASELANGRLAMMAIIGLFFQDGLTGSAYGDWANYVDSPLRAFESELGAQAPLGFFDPLKLTGDGSVEAFKRRRQSEIKHGRISMLAAMGYMTPEITGKFPGYLSPSLNLKFADVPNGLAAVSKVPAAGWAQILGYMAYCETSQDQSAGTPGAAGEFGFKVITSDDDEVLKRKLASELANGRLAMMAIIGMFYQDGLTGSPWGDWSLYTDSPLRAFESERGAQPPFGFWDPLGLSADGDVATFKRRRASEIKHGRIAMLAAMGYMTPEITGKFPGYLSPSTGVKYADIPNGLAAISKVPVVGWLQIFAWTAVCELWEDQVPGTPGHEGEFCFKAFKVTSDAPETRETKLASELANGRLAMMAIIGLFFQDGLTGSAYGDWANYVDSPLR